jgi:hypothetical protein
MSFHGLIAHFVLELGNIPLSGVPHSQLFEGHFGCFQVLAIMKKSCYKKLYISIFAAVIFQQI